MDTPSPEEQIRAAFAQSGDCPRPESFLEEELARLTPAQQAELMEHAERCPACGAERELARAFDASPEVLEANRSDLDTIVSALEANAPPAASPGSGRVVRIDSRRRPRLLGVRGLAAAAVIAVAALGMWIVTRSPEPQLPSIGTETAFRGTRIEVVGPVGELSEIPAAFEWKAVSEAESYRIRLLAVDDTVIWETTSSSEFAGLPEELAGQLHPAVVYTWQVEALDSAGNRIARSERERFRVRPSARSETK